MLGDPESVPGAPYLVHEVYDEVRGGAGFLEGSLLSALVAPCTVEQLQLRKPFPGSLSNVPKSEEV